MEFSLVPILVGLFIFINFGFAIVVSLCPNELVGTNCGCGVVTSVKQTHGRTTVTCLPNKRPVTPPPMQAAPKPMMQPVKIQPMMQPMMKPMMQPMVHPMVQPMMQPQQAAQPINITIVNNNNNDNQTPIKGHHGEEHQV